MADPNTIRKVTHFWVTVRPQKTYRDRRETEALIRRVTAQPQATVTPVFGDHLLQPYEQLALKLPIYEGPSEADNDRWAAVVSGALTSLDIDVSIPKPTNQNDVESFFQALEALRSRLPMLHPYYQVEVPQALARPALAALKRSTDLFAQVSEAPRLARDGWPPSGPFGGNGTPSFGGDSWQLYENSWQPKLHEQWNLAEINYLRIWQEEEKGGVKGKHKVTVAVIDSGIDFQHPDLDHAKAPDGDGVLLNRPPVFDQPDAHGTQVAGIIAARGDDVREIFRLRGIFETIRHLHWKPKRLHSDEDPIEGLRGIAPRAALLSLIDGRETAAQQRQRQIHEVTVTDRVAAMVRALRHGADVINLSWHFERTCCDTDTFFDSELQGPMLEALRLAVHEKVPVVCSVGNNSHLGYPIPYVSYPAAYDGIDYKGEELVVISAGAVDHKRRRTPNSNYRPAEHCALDEHQGRSYPTVMAPGYAVPSTDLLDGQGTSQGEYRNGASDPNSWPADYAPFGGTSAAAPHVTGVIALLLERVGPRSWPLTRIRAHIRDATDISNHNRDAEPNALGAGLLNAGKVLQGL